MEIPKLAAIALLISQLLFLASAATPPPSPSTTQFINCLKTQFPNQSNPIPEVIFTPQNPSFTPTLQAYIQNNRFNRSSTPKPLAIIAAKSYSHVQSAVLCAKTSGIQLRIRSGGHDFEGLSFVSSDPFVILDMFNLREVKIDVEKEVAWVQSGAILGEVYYNIAKKSNNTLAFPAGVCLTVGVGGHISGGGYGNLLRKYGLSVDNILDAQVVDAKGRILNRSTMGEDFFWAIRGGGAASFGVVLSYKLRLVRVPQTVTMFVVKRTLEEGATDIVDQWQRVAPNTDPDLFLRAELRAIDASGGNKSTVGVAFSALYQGGAKELVSLINKTFPLLGLQFKDCSEMSWAQSTMFWAWGDVPKGTPLEKMLIRSPSSFYSKHKLDYVKKPIPKKGLEAIWKKVMELGSNMHIQFNPYGGRMSEIAADATPFPHREGNLFKIQYLGLWTDESVEIEDKLVKATTELYDTFTPYVSNNPREAFLNYRDIDIGTNAKEGLGLILIIFSGMNKAFPSGDCSDQTNGCQLECLLGFLLLSSSSRISIKAIVM